MPEPLDSVLSMKQQGLTNNQIIQNLQRQGYDIIQINDAISQAEVTQGTEDYIPSATNIEEVPSPDDYLNQETPYSEDYQTGSYQDYPSTPSNRMIEDQVEAIAEKVVAEKWREFVNIAGDIPIWKSEVKNEIERIKSDLKSLNQQVNNLQQAIVGKVNEYNDSLIEVGSQLKAMEKVFEKILPPLTTNVRELSDITKKIKHKKQ